MIPPLSRRQDHGDAKLQAEGKADKLKGKVQNAVGGMKDEIRKQDDKD